MNERIYLSPPDVSETERQYLLDAFDSNWISPLGPHVDAFEREFGELVQMPAAVALSSGTAALHLALKAMGVKRGDTVLVSTLTFAATANPVTYLGASPAFIDSDRGTWTMDSALLAEELAARAKTGKLPAAVITVDLYGQSCDYDAIEAICRNYNVPIIADAAEAVGTFYKGQPAGTRGTCAAFSFNSNKIITTGGGGMLVASNRAFIERVRYLSTQARDPVPHYQHAEIGFNYRMSNLLAAIGRGQLSQLPRKVERRRAINERYRETISRYEGISFMPEAAYGRSNCWLTCILIDPATAGVSREEVRQHLESLAIESRPVWKPMHMQPAFAGCDVRGGDVAADLFERGLCLPSGSSLTDAEQARVIAAIDDLIERRWFVRSGPPHVAGSASLPGDDVAPVHAPILPPPPSRAPRPQPPALVALKRSVLRSHRVLAIGAQLTAMALTNYAAILLRFDGAPPSWAMESFWFTLPILIAIRAIVFIPFGLYQGLWRYTSINDLERLVSGIGLSSVLFSAFVLSPLGPSYPRSALMLDPLLLTLALSALRMSRRLYTDLLRGRPTGGRRVLIYGAGSAGEMVAREMRVEHSLGYELVGFLDDDPNLSGRRVHGVRVLGSGRDLARIADEHKPDEILIAMPSLDPAAMNVLVRTIQPLGIAIKTLPSLRHIISGKEVVSQARNLSVEDLITRVPANLDPAVLRAFVEGQSVLITGAGGSIGAELCRQLIRLKPSTLTLLDRHESSLGDVMTQLRARNSPVELNAVLCDCSDESAVNAAFAYARPTIVFHASGYAHGGLIEDNPAEAIRNDVNGATVIADAAIAHNVGRMVVVSTFKAANPSGVLGLTKRLVELGILERAGRGVTTFSVVRVGNVLGSSGSVVPKFVAQIQAGGPVTVTHADASRHFMLLADAVQLFLYAAAQASDGEVYALESQPVRVVDIASNLIRLAGLTPYVDIQIQTIGLRRGESITEQIMGNREATAPTSTPRVLRVVQTQSSISGAAETRMHLEALQQGARGVAQ